jgi:GNAT superfamily N-acetyltransferase
MRQKLSFRLLDCSEESGRKLSDFLNICYRERVKNGEGYLPDHQDEEATLKRIHGKEVWFCEDGDRIIGTFTIAPPGNASQTWWYRQRGVAEISQVAVHPAFQRKGHFSFIMDAAEKRAMELSALELAGSVPSQRKWLINAYLKRGARIVDYKWRKNAQYGWVIFSKTVQGGGVKSHFFPRLSRRMKYFRCFIKYKLLRKSIQLNYNPKAK